MVMQKMGTDKVENVTENELHEALKVLEEDNTIIVFG